MGRVKMLLLDGFSYFSQSGGLVVGSDRQRDGHRGAHSVVGKRSWQQPNWLLHYSLTLSAPPSQHPHSHNLVTTFISLCCCWLYCECGPHLWGFMTGEIEQNDGDCSSHTHLYLLHFVYDKKSLFQSCRLLLQSENIFMFLTSCRLLQKHLTADQGMVAE